MDDSQLVRTVRMLLRSYRTKYYALEERNIMRSVRGLRVEGSFSFTITLTLTLTLWVRGMRSEGGGQQGKPADARGEGGRGEREGSRVNLLAQGGEEGDEEG